MRFENYMRMGSCRWSRPVKLEVGSQKLGGVVCNIGEVSWA